MKEVKCEVKYLLREAEDTDIDFIYEIKKKYLYQYVEMLFGWDEEYQRNEFESDFNMYDFRIVVLDDESVGFVQTKENEYRINITEIHILPGYQGKGLGSLIINDINERAARNGKYVSADCFIANERACNLYRSLGFSLMEKTSTHYIFQYKK